MRRGEEFGRNALMESHMRFKLTSCFNENHFLLLQIAEQELPSWIDSVNRFATIRST